MTIREASPSIAGVQAYLFFGGRCEEALEFYRATLGARVEMLMRFQESPEAPPPGILPPGFENKIMHACFHVGETAIMASDGCQEGGAFSGFSLSLAVPTAAAAEDVFARLAEGGTIQMPLGKTFWSPLFGMLTDRFGVAWMVNVTPPAAT